jgi:hypothetical protein
MSYPDSPPLVPVTEVDLYLAKWAWGIEVAHWTYNADSPTRCTGVDGQVDCSGATVLCLNAAGRVTPCTNSSTLAIECHEAQRPQWMLDKFGPDPWTESATIGTGITAAQANVTPGAWGFHGPNQAMDGFGASGHIKSKWYLNDGVHAPGDSVEAMGVFAGVGFSTFLDPECTYFAICPNLGGFVPPAPSPLEGDMQFYVCPNKPPVTLADGSVELPHYEFYPAGTNEFLPNGGFVEHWGASIDGDAGWHSSDDPQQRILTPGAGGSQWVGCTERIENGEFVGFIVCNAQGHTSGVGSLRLS